MKETIVPHHTFFYQLTLNISTYRRKCCTVSNNSVTEAKQNALIAPCAFINDKNEISIVHLLVYIFSCHIFFDHLKYRTSIEYVLSDLSIMS